MSRHSHPVNAIRIRRNSAGGGGGGKGTMKQMCTENVQPHHWKGGSKRDQVVYETRQTH